MSAIVALGCSAAPASSALDPTDGFTHAELRSVIELAEVGDAESVAELYELEQAMSVEEKRRLVAMVDELDLDLDPPMTAQAYWQGLKLPVSWSDWPTGKYPYVATSAIGACGSDEDLIAKYRDISFHHWSELYLTTNNAATFLLAKLNGGGLTEYYADTTTRRVEICAGAWIFAGLPIVRDQLSSMTLNVSSSGGVSSW
ncbi:hypothetical protein WMF31_23815 [Sorangium sp. So ce1036]|nr:hypothetical protein [Sorangium cellulosum]